MSAEAIATVVIAVGAVLAGARWLGSRVVHLIRKLDRQDTLLFGDGTPQHPGLEAWQAQTTSSIDEAARLARIAAREAGQVANRLVRIEKEFHPNGGSSIRDQLDRLEVALTEKGGD